MSDSIRTLVVTDVVDSTGLAERIGDAAMAALWESHDRIARGLLRHWRGREIDKTDGMLTLFNEAVDGIGFARAYHRALALTEPPLKARAGLHVGPVTLRENAAGDVALGAKPLEVDGIAKPIVARVMAIAQGGQTLLTAEARAALGAAAAGLPSHGYWRVKGIAEPFEVFELVEPGSAGTPPPASMAKAYRVTRQGEHWLPLEQVPRNLPAERDAFVGRDEALEALARHFGEGARLVSIVGIGGCGKTRLATHFAWRWLGDFPGGIWFCDLAAARDIDGIVHAVAAALDVPLGKEDPVVQLGHAIAGRGDCLLILDNFEQVSRLAEDTLGRWLNRARHGRFLVTTREVLGLPGEQTFGLAPLSTPDARELFMRRAAAALRGFAPTAQDAAAIEPLVALLDRLPLAIELAAARVRVMSPCTLLARMSDRFRLLSSSGGRRDRQATLRAAFDWSWDLLQGTDKAALAQLSVFEGGFTLAAAEAVLDLGGDADAPWAVDVVQSLVDKSFVRPVGSRRFELLGLVQEYAGDKLRGPGRYADSGPAAEAAASARHGAYFAALGAEQATADACAELDNLVVACRRAVARGDVAIAANALVLAWAAIRLRGPFRLGVDLAAEMRALAGLPPSARARVERTAAQALQMCGRIAEARSALASALTLADEAGDSLCRAQALVQLSALDGNAGHMEEALAGHMAALALARELGASDVVCDAASGLGTVLEHLGRLDEARLRYDEALRVARQAGDRRREGGMLGNIGLVCANQGLLAEAEQQLGASLAIARECGDRQWEGNALSNLGLLHQVQGRLHDAHGRLTAALDVARAIGHTRLECIVLINLGMVGVAQSRLDEARVDYEAALTLAQDLADRRTVGQIHNYLGLLHARQGRFDAALHSLAIGEALLTAVADRMSLALLLCSRAEAEQLAGAAGAAREALERAQALAAALDAGPASELGQALARARGAIDERH